MAVAEDTQTLPPWFEVFRDDLNQRLGTQDGKLEQILHEARKTNGRVTALENNERERERVRKERAERIRKARETRDSERTRKAHTLEIAVTSCCILLGGMVASLGHIIGLW